MNRYRVAGRWLGQVADGVEGVVAGAKDSQILAWGRKIVIPRANGEANP